MDLAWLKLDPGAMVGKGVGWESLTAAMATTSSKSIWTATYALISTITSPPWLVFELLKK